MSNSNRAGSHLHARKSTYIFLYHETMRSEECDKPLFPLLQRKKNHFRQIYQLTRYNFNTPQNNFGKMIMENKKGQRDIFGTHVILGCDQCQEAMRTDL